MIFDHDGTDVELSLFVARQLEILASLADPSVIGVNVAQVSGLPNTQFHRDSNNVAPAMHYVMSDSFGVVFLSGVDSVLQAAGIVGAWSVPIPFPGIGYMPQFFSQRASEIAEFMTAGGRPIPPRLYFTGHSYGGLLAQATMRYFQFYGFGLSRLAISFGAPRCGGSAFKATLASSSNTRWMNDTDPVPLLPPDVPASLSYGVGLPNLVLDSWSRFDHAGGGIVLDPLGNSSPGVLPPLGITEGGASLVNWLYKAATDQSSTHNIAEYSRRLNLLRPRTVPPATVTVRVGQPEPSHSGGRASTNRQIKEWTDTIVHTGAAQNASVLRVPQERAFRTLKVDELWWVTFGGFLVAVGPTRKRAGAMAVRGNEFLRRLQRMAAVDTIALGNLMPIYLDAASTPGNGFEPPIAGFPR